MLIIVCKYQHMLKATSRVYQFYHHCNQKGKQAEIINKDDFQAEIW